MQYVLGVRERVVKQARSFFPDAINISKTLDLFKSAPGVTQKGGPGTSAPNILALLYFPLCYFISYNAS